MNIRLLKKVFLVLMGAVVTAVAISMFTATTASFPFQYKITDLGTLPGQSNSRAYAINARGQVVGDSFNGGKSFLWDNGTMTNLGSLNKNYACDINNAGVVLGCADPMFRQRTNDRSVLWQNGTLTELPPLPGHNTDVAYSLNNRGQVVGVSWSNFSTRHAVLWNNSVPTDVGTFSGDVASEAFSINNKRQVAGVSANSNFTWRSVLWDTGSITDLKIPSQSGANVPFGINNKGQVVGGSTTSLSFAFLWQNGTVTSLGGLPSGSKGIFPSIAYSINNAGRVVGTSGSKAFIWYNKKMYDLNDLVPADSGWKLEVARDINNKGQIVGWGKLNGKSEYRAFLLTPTLNP